MCADGGGGDGEGKTRSNPTNVLAGKQQGRQTSVRFHMPSYSVQTFEPESESESDVDVVMIEVANTSARG